MNKEKMNYEQRLLHVTVAAGILFSVIEVMIDRKSTRLNSSHFH